MKQTILLFVILLHLPCCIFAQDVCGWNFNSTHSCQINVNTNYPNFNSREAIKRATLKYNIDGGGCTGTLINTSNNRQLFVTAAHCLKKGPTCDGNWKSTYIDENNPGAICTLVFNYQSPNENTLSTPYTNVGCITKQTNSTDINIPNNIGSTVISKGNEYVHESFVKLLYVTKFPLLGGFTDCTAGDMAVLEILKPIPAHFNVYYAGWSPETFNKPPYAVIHHPNGDVKKISEINGGTTLDSGPISKR